MQDATPLLLLSNQTVTASGNSPNFALPQAECYALILVATAVSGTTPAANAVLQMALDGTYGNGSISAPAVAPTTWINTAMAFASLAAVGNQTLIFKPTMSIGESASVATVTPGTASAKNSPIRRQFLRLNFGVTGTTPSFTYSLYALANPKGYSVA